MTTPDIQQARDWAKDVSYHPCSYDPEEVEAAKIILNLPDTVVDGDRLREVINKVLANTIHGTVGHQVAEDYAALIGELIPTPPLPTFEDMTAEEREACQWMQAQVFTTFSAPGIITNVDEYARSAIILFTDGMAKNVPWKEITPLLDLPKLEWPGDGVEDAPIVDGEPTLPRPEDVPVGEAWLVSVTDTGVRCIALKTNNPRYPWAFADNDDVDYYADHSIGLVSRLVPERKENA